MKFNTTYTFKPALEILEEMSKEVDRFEKETAQPALTPAAVPSNHPNANSIPFDAGQCAEALADAIKAVSDKTLVQIPLKGFEEQFGEQLSVLDKSPGLRFTRKLASHGLNALQADIESGKQTFKTVGEFVRHSRGTMVAILEYFMKNRESYVDYDSVKTGIKALETSVARR